MILYKSYEVIKLTGITSPKLKYMDDHEKLIPYKRSASTRYYTEEQVIEILQYMNKAADVAYVCIEHTNNFNNNVNIINKDKLKDLLKKKEIQLKNSIANYIDNKDIIFISEILVNRNFNGSSLEMISKKAIFGAIKKVYIDTEIGFPPDLIPEYTKWLSYVNVEFVNLAKIRRENNTGKEVTGNE